jgi:hypothetical protein
VHAHIFLCVMAHHLLIAIEKTLLDQGIHTSWPTVRDTLKTHQVCTLVLPTSDGSILRIRKRGFASNPWGSILTLDSGGFGSLIRRAPYDGQITAWLVQVRLRLPSGTSPYKALTVCFCITNAAPRKSQNLTRLQHEWVSQGKRIY